MWNVDRDECDFVNGISYDGTRVIQLSPGTVRNEECVNIVVDVLNRRHGAYAALENKVAKITAPNSRSLPLKRQADASDVRCNMANSEIIGAGQDTARPAPKDIRILAACEESQAVCIAFRSHGFDAYSCDVLPCSGGHDEWHLQADIVRVLQFHDWDMVIAFPPCTHLCSSGARHFAEKRADGRQQNGIDFFMQFTKLTCLWAIENPVGIMSSIYRKPDQIVHPWQFGHRDSKATCLWLHGLPKLVPTEIVEPVWCENTTAKGKKTSLSHNKPRWENQTPSGQNKLGPSPDRATLRSKTYPGIARAMAEQWGAHVLCARKP